MADKPYLVVNGINYTPTRSTRERRAWPGDTVTDLPRAAIPVLLAQGDITEIQQEGGEQA